MRVNCWQWWRDNGCHVWLVAVNGTLNKTGTILGLECQVMHFGGNQFWWRLEWWNVWQAKVTTRPRSATTGLLWCALPLNDTILGVGMGYSDCVCVVGNPELSHYQAQQRRISAQDAKPRSAQHDRWNSTCHHKMTSNEQHALVTCKASTAATFTKTYFSQLFGTNKKTKNRSEALRSRLVNSTLHTWNSPKLLSWSKIPHLFLKPIKL